MAPLIIIILVGVNGRNKSGVLGTSYPSSKEISELRFDLNIPVALKEQTGITDDLIAGRSTAEDVHVIRIEDGKRTSKEFV